MSDTNQEPNVVTIKIADLDVTLPIRFAADMGLTENQAKVLDAAYQRQFTNNQNALAKARAIALEKATTDEEKAAKAPLTATAIAALYTDYEPNVGGTRMGSMDKIKSDAAWRMWTALVTEHNENVANGGEPVIVKAGNEPVSLPSGKGAVEKREALIAALLTLPAYADRIQVRIDEIMAERGATKGDTKVEAVASDIGLL